MKKKVLFGFALLCGVFLTNVMAAEPSVDPATYAPRGANGELTLTSKWLYSNVLNNYNLATDLIAPAATARGMAVKDGKMLFIDRTNKQIVVVNGTTGLKETPIKLADNVFKYLGRNKANTQDSLIYAGTLQYNDIKIDNAGNVLVGNLYEASASNPNQRFQIWKIDLTTGNGTVVIDDYLSRLYPSATSTTLRFDAFGVWGDVTKSAIIMAANAKAMEVYKWNISNGVVSGDPVLIELDNITEGTYLTGKANPGSAPQVFPLDENYFYLDGNETYPTLIDNEGTVIDGFYAKPSAIKDSVTAPATDPKTIWTMNQGHNGVVEFQMGDNYFLLMAASNTVGVPVSTFRLFKFADAGKAFTGLTCLWTFPQAGMGAASNSYRTAMPSVEVSGNTAKMYVYTGENGYGMYEMTVANTPVDQVFDNNAVAVTVSGKTINLSEMVSTINVYNYAGQLIARDSKVSSVDIDASGLYIVKATTVNGITAVHKVVIK